VQKSASDPHNPGCWELPGGRMKGAEDLDQHIQREVLEEVGLHVEPAQPVHIWSWEMQSNGSQVRVVAVARLCNVISGHESTEGSGDDDHISGLRWWVTSALRTLNVIPGQKEAVKKVLELLDRNPDSATLAH